MGEVGLEGGQMVCELLVDDQNLRLGVVDDVGHLGWGQSPVHGDGDRVGEAAAERQLEVLGAVLVDIGDAFLGAHPRGAQGVGDLPGPIPHLGPRDAFVADDEHFGIGLLGDPGEDDVCDAGDFSDVHGSRIYTATLSLSGAGGLAQSGQMPVSGW